MSFKPKQNTKLNEQLIIALKNKELFKTLELMKNGGDIHNEIVYLEVERLMLDNDLFFVYSLTGEKDWELNFFDMLSESPHYSYNLFEYLIKIAKIFDLKSIPYKKSLQNVIINCLNNLKFNKELTENFKKNKNYLYKGVEITPKDYKNFKIKNKNLMFNNIIKITQEEYKSKFNEKFIHNK